jgi:hypothetical protein
MEWNNYVVKLNVKSKEYDFNHPLNTFNYYEFNLNNILLGDSNYDSNNIINKLMNIYIFKIILKNPII